MRVLIDGGYGFDNMGDVAMLQAAVSRLSRMWPGVSIGVLTNSPDKLARYCPGTEAVPLDGQRLWVRDWNVLGAARRLVPQSWQASLRRLETAIRMNRPRATRRWVEFRLARRGVDVREMQRYLELLADSDAVIACGGGNIADVFEHNVRFQLELLGTAKALGKLVAMFGQGIGPVHSKSLRRLMRAVLPKLDLIALREGQRGPGLLKAVGTHPSAIMVTGDDAIEVAYGLRPRDIGDALGINLRVARYSDVGRSEVDALRRVIIEAARRHACGVFPVPIRGAGPEAESDCETLEQILSGITDDFGGTLDAPERVIRQIGRCRVVITGAYHVGVFALAQGVSVIGLFHSEYYQDKFLGLAEQFGAGCRVLDLSHLGFVQRAADAIDAAWHEAAAVRPVLLQAAEGQIREVQRAYQRLRELSLKKACA